MTRRIMPSMRPSQVEMQPAWRHNWGTTGQVTLVAARSQRDAYRWRREIAPCEPYSKNSRGIRHESCGSHRRCLPFCFRTERRTYSHRSMNKSFGRASFRLFGLSFIRLRYGCCLPAYTYSTQCTPLRCARRRGGAGGRVDPHLATKKKVSPPAPPPTI